MNNNTKKVFFLFNMLDYIALQNYFEKMAAQGWMLEKITAFGATFQRTAPQNIKFTVDIYPAANKLLQDYERGQEYKEACELTGWHFIDSIDGTYVFYADEDENPIPIQTDRETELRILKKKVVSFKINIILITIFCMMFLFKDYMYLILYSNLLLASVLIITIFILKDMLNIPYNVIQHARIIRSLKKPEYGWNQSINSIQFISALNMISNTLIGLLLVVGILLEIWGKMLPIIIALSVIALALIFILAMRLRERYLEKHAKKVLSDTSKSIIIVLAVAISALLIGIGFNLKNKYEISPAPVLPAQAKVMRLSDLGIEGEDGCSTSISSSILVPEHYEYSESHRNFSIETVYDRTTHPALAQAIFEGMGNNQLHKIIYGEPVSAPAEVWNADKAYYFSKFWNKIVLLKGNIVVSIYASGDIDLADPDTIAICRAKLGLDD